jgi:transcriptional regulator with XRE-family HTH domain
MAWFTKAAQLIDSRNFSRAEIGRRLNITGQAVTLKLQGKRPTNVTEAQVFAEYAGVSVSEMLGDEAYLIEARDELELVALFRLLTAEQRARLVEYARFMLQGK